ncbi:Alpha/Beta hydrolase protein [Russula ochroleuca]|uniref:Alpha/Beta hydrolase protein n=1 Tax=Russula ochroleuca TaxID=152965 RepID=A0A9P5MQT5_9AGAM|nr:Alpha/Beta hydrolase protein [Russula ochroleuca]
MIAVIPKHLILFHKARRLCLLFGCIYMLVVAVGATPFAQAQLLFMHNLKRPFFTQYDMPEKYDLAPFKTHNVRIHTADNETLGAWFMFADPFYAVHKTHLLNISSPASIALSRDDYIRAALRAHPTILFLHGTTGTRAVRIRVQQYQAFASRVGANVLAPDYRGFADSTGTPSEAGLTIDTRAAWDWLRARGASPDSVLVVGSSLGTGVAVHCGAVVHERPRGVVLLSPFSKLETLLDTYYILGLMPLFAPLRTLPYLSGKSPFHASLATCFVKKFIVHRFDSLAKVVGLNAPVLIVHAEDDQDIPVWHAKVLFDAFLEKHLPPLPKITTGMVNASKGRAKGRFSALLQERAVRRKELVTAREMERVGKVEEFSKDRGDNKVVFMHTWWGAHDVGLLEGVQDYMVEMFEMTSPRRLGAETGICH